MGTTIRTPATVVGVACPSCGGRGRHYVGDDRSFPYETTCRRCNGVGIVAPPAGSRAASIAALVPCASCDDTGLVDGDLCCFCDTGAALFWRWEQRQDPAVA